MSDRGLTSASIAALDAEKVNSFSLVKFNFAVPLFYTDAPYDFDYAGDTYLSNGTLVTVPVISETIDIKANTISLKMSGVELAAQSITVNDFRYVEVTIYRVIIDTVNQVIPLYIGYIDSYSSLENARRGTADITWKISNHWTNWEHKNGRRITNDSQQALFAGDDGFKFAGVTDSVSSFWGDRAFMDFSHYVPPEHVKQVYSPTYYDIWLWGIEHNWENGNYDWENGGAGDKALPVAYGYCSITGTPVFRAVTGTRGETLWVVYALCEGEIDSVDAIYLDGTEYRSSTIGAFVSMTFHSGTDTQAADAPLVAAAVDWTSACQLKGVAYVVMKYTYDSDKFSGEPTPRFVVRGKKCFDPRDSSADWLNGSNPALVLRDYLTNTRYGKAIPAALLGNINASADICDVKNLNHDGGLGIEPPTLISTYIFSGYIDTNKDIKKNVNEILFTMFGHIPWSGGLYNLRLESEALTSVYDFDEASINDVVNVTEAGIKATANTIVYQFTNSRENWNRDSVTVQSSTFLAEDNGVVVSQTVTNRNEPNNYRAENHADTLLKKSRSQKNVTIKASSAKALLVEVGDMVRFTYASKGWVLKEFRVVAMKITRKNEVTLTVFEYDAAAFNWAVSVETDIPNDSVLATPYSVAPITSLSLSSGTAHLLAGADGSITSRIFVDFVHPADAFADHVIILFKKSTETDYVLGAQVSRKEASECFLTPVEDGVLYNIRVHAVNTLGVRSAAVDLNHTVIGKTAAPSAPTGLSESSTLLNTVNLAWTGISDADLSHYEIFAYISDAYTSAVFVGSSKTTRFAHSIEAALYYWVRAVDTSGLVSPFSSTTGVLGSPDGLSDFIAGAGVNITPLKYSWFEHLSVLPAMFYLSHVSVSIASSHGFFGDKALLIATTAVNGYVYLAASNTDYNIPITPNKKWMISAYVKFDVTNSPSGDMQFFIRTGDGTHYGLSKTVTVDGLYHRVYGVIDLSASASTQMLLRVDNDGFTSVSADMYIDGIMIEEQVGGLEIPSAYSLPVSVLSLPETEWSNADQAWADVSGAGIPEDNATLGATWDSNIDGDALPDSYSATDIIMHDWIDVLDTWGLLNATLTDGLRLSGASFANRTFFLNPKYTWNSRRFFTCSFTPSGLVNHSTTNYSYFIMGGVPPLNRGWGFAFKRTSGSTVQVYGYTHDGTTATYYLLTGATFTDGDNVRFETSNNAGGGAITQFNVYVNGTPVLNSAITIAAPTGTIGANLFPYFTLPSTGVVVTISDYYFHQYN